MACLTPEYDRERPMSRFTLYFAINWLMLIVVAAMSANLLPVPPPDHIDWTHLAAKPGVAGHLLGTDGLGRDILSRLIYGSRVSLVVGFLAPAIGLLLGVLFGLMAGYLGGVTDRAISGTIDIFLAFPRLVFLLMAMFVFGSNLLNLTVALGLICTPSFARMARANTIKLKQREFVLAAKTAGASNGSIIRHEILPNILSPLFVYMLLAIGLVIIAEGSLGFLGLSVPPPTPSWGGMIAEGRETLDQSPHVSLIPMIFMFLTIVSINLIGERLRRKEQA